MTDEERQVVKEVGLRAEAEQVWRALTDANELTRWFPLAADVEPRVGGRVSWRWGRDFEWTTRVDLWEAPRRLRLVQEADRPLDVEGQMTDDSVAERRTIVLDFQLSSGRGETRLRLVHSGFGAGAAWDDEIEGVRNGWDFELANLAHYLRYHHGRARTMGWAVVSTAVSCDVAWDALVGPRGFGLSAGEVVPGQPYAVHLPDGTRLSGRITVAVPARELIGTVDQLDNGVLRLGVWPAAGACGATARFATWSPRHGELAGRLGQDALTRLKVLFGARPALGQKQEAK
jgi:uncharacterized protein YndB with AHSA1/START domain